MWFLLLILLMSPVIAEDVEQVYRLISVPVTDLRSDKWGQPPFIITSCSLRRKP